MTPSTTTPAALIHSTWTINELLQRLPGALRPLHALGVHTCCDGELTLEAAAVKAGIQIDALLTQLEASVGAIALTK